MSKKFLVDGISLTIDGEITLNGLRKMLKKDVVVEEVEDLEFKKALEQHTATYFIAEARRYLSLSPPDFDRSAEKAWLAVVYALKELFLTCGGVDLKSMDSVKYFFRFVVTKPESTKQVAWNLYDCWTKVEEMHQDSSNFSPKEQAKIIPDVENLVHEFSSIDREKFWAEFNKEFIVGSRPDVDVIKESHIVHLGGIAYNCDYSVFV